MKVKSSEWNIKPSSLAMNSVNPIRNIVEKMKITPNPEKKMITLSIGRYSANRASIAACDRLPTFDEHVI